MHYINYKYSNQTDTETIDEFETLKEAKAMIKEYRQAYSEGELWLSNRATKEWREQK